MHESDIQRFIDSIPDDTTPVFGFRAWKWSKRNYGGDFPMVLKALAREVWWSSDGPTYGVCQNPDTGPWKGEPHCPGPVPQWQCTCGNYAKHTVETLIPYVGREIVGAVIGWGNSEYGVIRHGPEGWRSEIAIPIGFVRTRVSKMNPGGAPSSTRHYTTLDSTVPGMLEQLAYRLGARLFDTIGELDHWVRTETPYASFWTPEDERRYLSDSTGHDARTGQ